MRRLLAFLLPFVLTLDLGAELPPSAYEAMQRKAAEVLRINVLRTDTDPESPEVTGITLLVEVVKVGRSERGLKPGELITIKYQVTERPQGWVGPGEIPIPALDAETVAFLGTLDGTGDFTPVAGAMSFSTF